ncbi:MAG: DUF1456 family protein [Spirochaetes bacterium]|nr:DUF1456 family protein [Spirochaetota bacterium]
MISTYNDVLRRLRFALNLRDTAVVDILGNAGYRCGIPEVVSLMKKEEDPGFEACSDYKLALFLDGLIIDRRGRREGAPAPQTDANIRLSNNIILKKLRIAFEFKDEDMLAVFELGDKKVSKPELSAFFRKAGHHNYKDCGDQYLRAFLRGIIRKFRPDSPAETNAANP